MIEVRDVAAGYGGREVLRGVTFTARPGEVTGYLGPNGSGKSTTMRVLTGLLRPTRGTVSIAGHDLATHPLEAKRRLGYVPESQALYATLTANEYLSLVAELYHLDRPAAAEKIRQLLGVFDLLKDADRPIENYSKGMRQKVLLASALLHDPDVVLLDEPFNGLDVNAASSLRRMIVELAARGKTVLFCSHILEVVEKLCTRVVMLRDGAVAADAPTAELLAQSKGGTLEAAFQELTAAMTEASWGEWKQAFFGDAAATDAVPKPAAAPPRQPEKDKKKRR